MSHFSVVVCLGDEDGKLARAAQAAQGNFPDGAGIPALDGPALLRRVINERLESVMAPWDENREMEPYRDYEKGEPGEYWLYRSLKRADEDDRNGTGILPHKPDEAGWSSSSSKKTPSEQAMQIAKEAAVFRSLPKPPTWESPLDALAILYPDDESEKLFVDGDRAYSMSTYNPDSKWDYWRIGGRWGGYFTRKPDSDSASVILPEKGWDSPGKFGFYGCDAGPKSMLDLGQMREKGAEKARENYEGYHAIMDSLPEGKPWAEFRAQVEAGAIDINLARNLYHEQPRVKALHGTDFQYGDDAIAEYGGDISVYAERGRAKAVPGFALVTVDGRWMAPGRMGWFAATDATESSECGYGEVANAYIDSLPDDAWLIAVDCHI